MGIKSRGFTIVELLIVIVIIAILAAITIVAYNGIQNRAKTSAGQSAANSLVKKFEAINAVKGVYYTSSTGVAGAAINTYANTAPTATEAVIDNPSNVIAATNATTANLTASTASNGNVVSAFVCAGGANVWYWDYTAASSNATLVKAGAGC